LWRTIREGRAAAVSAVPIGGPRLAIGEVRPTEIFGGIFLAGINAVEAVLAEQLDEELVLRQIGGAEFGEERTACGLTVATVGIATRRAAAAEDVGSAKVGVRGGAIG